MTYHFRWELSMGSDMKEIFEKHGIHHTYCNIMIHLYLVIGMIEYPELCEHCKRVPPKVAHHRDYFKPLDVLWLCHDCHRQDHVKLTKSKQDPKTIFYQKIVESPEGENYLIRLRQFYSRVSELSSELFGEDSLDQFDAFENNDKLSAFLKTEEN